jgi:hypothetical protein
MIASIREMPAAKRAELVRALENLASILGADELAPRMLFDDESAPPKAVRTRPAKRR